MKWTKCADEMPPVGDRVLIFSPAYNLDGRYGYGQRIEGECYEFETSDRLYPPGEVTHWAIICDPSDDITSEINEWGVV
jgi:hypothetical protein